MMKTWWLHPKALLFFLPSVLMLLPQAGIAQTFQGGDADGHAQATSDGAAFPAYVPGLFSGGVGDGYTAGAFAPQTVSITPGDLAAAYALGAARPNPSSSRTTRSTSRTTLSFSLPDDVHVRLIIFDVAGRRVATLVDAQRSAGRHEVAWRGTDDAGRRVAPGIYFYRIKAGPFVESKRIVLVR